MENIDYLDKMNKNFDYKIDSFISKVEKKFTEFQDLLNKNNDTFRKK
jgi:hypothetical protein